MRNGVRGTRFKKLQTIGGRQDRGRKLAFESLESRQFVAVLLFGAISCLASVESEGAWIFLGPTPYLSKADSPFPVDGSNPTFFLEDFEDGEFGKPGARMNWGGGARGYSVDADDGLIDGSGVDSFSGSATALAISGSSTFVTFEVEFDAQILGFLPTAVGFVLTDGAGPASGFLAYDATGTPQEFFTWDIQSDGLTTSDDRFVGVTNLDGISKITFGKTIFHGNPTANPRIDHFQYGLIPAPGGLTLMIAAFVMSGVIIVWTFWRRSLNLRGANQNRINEFRHAHASHVARVLHPQSNFHAQTRSAQKLQRPRRPSTPRQVYFRDAAEGTKCFGTSCDWQTAARQRRKTNYAVSIATRAGRCGIPQREKLTCEIRARGGCPHE